MQTVRQALIVVSLCVFATGLARSAAGQSLTNPASLPRVAPSPGSPSTYGTTRTSYLVVNEMAFSPFNSATTYNDIGFGSTSTSRYATGGIGSFLAPLPLPDGALLVSAELDACDSNASDDHVIGVVGECDMFGRNCVALSSSIQTSSDLLEPCKAYTQDLTGLNYTVDNQAHNYFLQASTKSLDNTNSISAMRIGYRLQVSPAAGQTFNDVPPGDFGYQFIEALAASGITGGCSASPPLFCPDATVTRRQMAIFIAKALGLQWP